MEEQVLDVTVPPGVGAGDAIAVTYGDATFDVTVPDGVGEGDVFPVVIPAQQAPEIDDILAALNVVLDALETHEAVLSPVDGYV